MNGVNYFALVKTAMEREIAIFGKGLLDGAGLEIQAFCGALLMPSTLPRAKQEIAWS